MNSCWMPLPFFRTFKLMKWSQQELPPILKNNLLSIRKLCQKHRVKKLWVFGSVLRKDFRKDSDIDFLYEWDRRNIKDEEYLDNLWELLNSLKTLFGRRIDFVHYPSLKNPYFIEELRETRVLLFDKKREEIPV